MAKYKKTVVYENRLLVVLEEGDHTFVMDEENLLSRIRNLEKGGFKANGERKALKFLRAHEKYVPPKK